MNRPFPNLFYLASLLNLDTRLLFFRTRKLTEDPYLETNTKE